MTLFNLSRWIANRMTDGSDRDVKIVIVGGPGTGKSKTALSLAIKIDKWLSWYKYHDFEHTGQFFKMDSDHLAIIVAADLFEMMTKYPDLNQVRIADDCANSRGFNARTSMSNENMDTNSIMSTNRTRRCCTIITMHDEDFQDKRQAIIADVLIDLRDYVQSGRFRMARLFHVRMDRKRANGGRKVRYCRFSTRGPNGWEVIESLACEMPSPEICHQYDQLRDSKDRENTERIYSKYHSVAQKVQLKDERVRCKHCNSIQLSVKKNGTKCLKCGRYQN